MLRSHLTRVTLGVLTLAGLAACSGSDSDGAFSAGAEKYPLSCLQHQEQMPGAAYSGEDKGNTAAVFQMLEYYTANKTVRTYCDREGPSKVDRAWAWTYVALGADRMNVAHLLG